MKFFIYYIHIKEVSMVREFTYKLLNLCEQGIVEWEDVAREVLQRMSDDEVEDVYYVFDDDFPDVDDDNY